MFKFFLLNYLLFHNPYIYLQKIYDKLLKVIKESNNFYNFFK